MSADRPFTVRPFTVVVCAPCGGDVSAALLSRLRGVIANCPHGVLVQSRCLLGGFACSGHPRGQVVLLQPCNTARVPTAAVQWIGPVRTESDVEAACAWIGGGRWDRRSLAAHLQMDLNMAAIARSN